ncbi:MAG: ComF family protein [bacterium]
MLKERKEPDGGKVTLPGLFSALWDFVLPPRCMACGKQGGGTMCPACADTIRRMGDTVCPVCGKELPPGALSNVPCSQCRRNPRQFTTCRSALKYTGAAAEAMKKYKFSGRRHYWRFFAARMSEYWVERPALFPEAGSLNCIVPVPMHWRRLMARKYNQSELLAAGLGRAMRVPVRKALVRTRHGKPQWKLKKYEERRRNVRGAFAVRGRAAVEGRRIMLVDDVYTTGATADECSRMLMERGAEAVHVFTLARRTFD